MMSWGVYQEIIYEGKQGSFNVIGARRTNPAKFSFTHDLIHETTRLDFLLSHAMYDFVRTRTSYC